ncbi:MAG: 23S rRNA (uracil(1939)-C(5))-methyltransferase RlmD [Lachnospiraceae bacterium]|nr:23S rRNA (uracil(1939)-C(5))-methyltransferase RlmD [Lachnospiraceae bacterium]
MAFNRDKAAGTKAEKKKSEKKYSADIKMKAEKKGMPDKPKTGEKKYPVKKKDYKAEHGTGKAGEKKYPVKKTDIKAEPEVKKAVAKGPCPVHHRCGGCQYLGMTNGEQLKKKERTVKELLKDICPVEPVIGMEEPWRYRNKVHGAFAYVKGKAVSGMYEESTHRVVPVERCLIEDEKADAIICTVRDLLKSFRVRVYDEDTGFGLLRRVLVRRGFATGQILVVLVCASPVFPSKNNFVKALRKEHPEITSVVLNVNDKYTSMILGERNITLYGKGYIEDVLCGKTFRISPSSFYQINPVQTEKLYRKAIELAKLTGKERIIDAYCGIGTIGQIASDYCGEVIGVELNKEAVADARINAKINGVKNATYIAADAGAFMVQMAEKGEKVDVLFMDPPRAGSDLPFIESAVKLQPEKIVYISCNPETLARDLKIFKKKGYKPEKATPVDLFPWTAHVEVVCVLHR